MTVIETRDSVERIMRMKDFTDYDRCAVGGSLWNWAVDHFGYERASERLELMPELALNVVDLGVEGPSSSQPKHPWRSLFCGGCRSFSFKLKYRGDERVILCANCEDEIGDVGWVIHAES